MGCIETAPVSGKRTKTSLPNKPSSVQPTKPLRQLQQQQPRQISRLSNMDPVEQPASQLTFNPQGNIIGTIGEPIQNRPLSGDGRIQSEISFKSTNKQSQLRANRLLLMESEVTSKSRFDKSAIRASLPPNEITNSNRQILDSSKLPPALLEERMRMSTASLSHTKMRDPPIPVIKLNHSKGSSLNSRVQSMHEYPINNEQEVSVPPLRLDIHIDIY